MTRRLPLLGCILGVLLLQLLMALLLPDWLRPDAVLLLALGLGLRTRATESLLLAFAIGFLVDILSSAPLGLHGVLRGTACALTRVLDRSLYLRAAGPWVLYVFVYAGLDGVGGGALLRGLVPDAAPPWADLLARLPGMAFGTALLAAPGLSLLRRIEPDPERETGWLGAASRGLGR